jgi:hypothetical protein
MTVCDECGFAYGVLPRHVVVARLDECGSAFVSRLAADPAVLCRRRSPAQWSPLEYACHVRDVALMQRDRIYVALVEDEPSFKPMYRDERVVFDRYGAQSPAVVAGQVVMASGLLSHAFAGLTDPQWLRPLVYGFPEPERHDVEWVAHHSLHEMVHHLDDIDRLLSDG